MGLLDRAMSAMRGTSTPATPTGTPFPDLSGAQGATTAQTARATQGPTTAQAARASGGMSPEAAAYNAQPKGGFTQSTVPSANTSLGYRAGQAINQATGASSLTGLAGKAIKGAVKVGGKALPLAGAAYGMYEAVSDKDKFYDDPNVSFLDKASQFGRDVIPHAAGYAGSVLGGAAGAALTPEFAFAGAIPGAAAGYPVGFRLAREAIDENGDTYKAWKAAHPSAPVEAGPKAAIPEQSVVHRGPATPPPAATGSTGATSAPDDKFSRLVDQLSNAQPTAPVVRVAPAAASSYREPPKLDTSMVAGDATGLGTLAKINAQYPAAAEWSAGMKRAKNQDALQLQAEAAGDLNARAGDQLKMQGLGKAADIYAQQAQRQHERGLAMNKLAYDRANDTEKRYEKRIEDTFGAAFDKDGKPNQARQKFETALNSYLDQATEVLPDGRVVSAPRDKRSLTPDEFEKILLSSQSAAYNPTPGVGSQLLQKVLGGSTAATANSMDATRPTGDTALGGVFVKTADERYKLGADVHGGGVVTDVFNAPNREVQSRFAREAAAAKRSQGN